MVVRSAQDHGAMYLRNEFAGVETHIINRVCGDADNFFLFVFFCFLMSFQG